MDWLDHSRRHGCTVVPRIVCNLGFESRQEKLKAFLYFCLVRPESLSNVVEQKVRVTKGSVALDILAISFKVFHDATRVVVCSLDIMNELVLVPKPKSKVRLGSRLSM